LCYLSYSVAFKSIFDDRYKEEDFPVTNQLVKEVLSLPMHTELDDEQIKFITSD
jgi:dTDP-4-amino-4,6-dideoxygalactose transaminase